MRQYLFIIVTILIGGISCQKSSIERYEAKLKKELASGEKNNDIFYDIHLGMEKEKFFEHCFELNKTSNGTIKNGGKNINNMMTVNTEIKELPSPANMDFFPAFHNDKIYEMGILFDYKAWSPWNKDLEGAKLQQDVVVLMQKWYGGEFIEMKAPNNKKAYISVQGNRRIMVEDLERECKVTITDMPVFLELKEKK